MTNTDHFDPATGHAAGLPGDLIPLREAARLLPGLKPGRKIHVSTLYRLIHRGGLPFWRVGHLVYVSRSDVLRLARPGVPRRARVEMMPAVVRSEAHARAVAELARHGLAVG